MDDGRETVRAREAWTLSPRAEQNLQELEQAVRQAREEAELPGTPAARLCRSAVLERSEELLEQLAAAVKGGRSRPKGSLDRLAAELRGDVRRSSLYFRAVQLVCESIRPAGCSLVLDDRDLEAPRET